MRAVGAVAAATVALLAPAAPAAAGFFTDAAIESVAPIVVFHDRERYHPSSAEHFIDHSGLAWNHDGGCRAEYHRRRFHDGVETPWSLDEIRRLGDGGFVQRLRLPRAESCALLDSVAYRFDTRERTRPFEGRRSELLGKAEGWYLDLSNGHREGFPDRKAGSGEYETAAPAYYDDGLLYRDGAPTGSAFVTFWFLYDYNDGPFSQNHEGDWENVSIRLEPSGDGEWTPVQVYYAKHGDKQFGLLKRPDIVGWSQAQRLPSSAGSRLAVFSAKGSHAGYGSGVSPARYLDRIDRDGPRWLTWKRLRFLWDQEWTGYCGAWGRVGRISDTTGPLGPGCLGPGRRPLKSGRPSDWGSSSAAAPGADSGQTIALES